MTRTPVTLDYSLRTTSVSTELENTLFAKLGFLISSAQNVERFET
jgi:hypothetical protein